MSAAPILRVFPDKEQLSRAAAEEFVALARQASAQRGRFTVALAGGSTPRRLYQLLADAPFRPQVDWEKVEFFWGDERTVPPNHQESNFRLAREALLARLAIAAKQIHRLEGERPDRDAAAADYQREIARVFGVAANGPPPAFDLALLGMGPDGHTASLFPHTAALKEETRWVVANHVPQHDTCRLTLTYPILNRAALAMFVVSGAEKAPVLAEVLEGPPDCDRLPSQRIRPVGKLLWMLDAAAAARLSRSVKAPGQ